MLFFKCKMQKQLINSLIYYFNLVSLVLIYKNNKNAEVYSTKCGLFFNISMNIKRILVNFYKLN
jgi:hypothetical protein